MNNRIDWLCPYLTQIKLPVEFLIEFTHDSTVQERFFFVFETEAKREKRRERNVHIITTNDVQTKHDLFYTCIGWVHPLVTFFHNHIHMLIETFQRTLRVEKKIKSQFSSTLNTFQKSKFLRTTIFRPSLVITDTTSVSNEKGVWVE